MMEPCTQMLRGPITRHTIYTVTSWWLLEALSLKAKGPGLEADHSAPSSAKVKNDWSCISTIPCTCMV
jgi:hypothetical protein